MIAVLLSEDGKVFKIYDPKTKEDLTDQYEVNHLVVQTKDGKYKAGFHIGQDCTDEIEAALSEVEEDADAALEEELDPTQDNADGSRFIGDKAHG